MTREPLSFAGSAVALGSTAELRLKVAESYAAEPVTVPVTVVRGAPGPTLFVTATVHGDELNGVGILRGLLDGTDFSLLAGTLIAVPVVNVPGFLNQDRRLPDRRDLNRSFPGRRKGGILDLRVDLGQPLRRGQEIAVNANPFGRERSQLRSPRGGIVLGLTRLPLVHPGDAVCNVACLDRRQVDAWETHWEQLG